MIRWWIKVTLDQTDKDRIESAAKALGVPVAQIAKRVLIDAAKKIEAKLPLRVAEERKPK